MASAASRYSWAMTPDEARTILTGLHMTVADLAEMLATLGDDRPRATIQRMIYSALTLTRSEKPEARPGIPWAVAGLLRMLALYRSAVSDQRYLADFQTLKVRRVAPRARRVRLRSRRLIVGG
jgi:hypothetical protein